MDLKPTRELKAPSLSSINGAELSETSSINLHQSRGFLFCVRFQSLLLYNMETKLLSQITACFVDSILTTPAPIITYHNLDLTFPIQIVEYQKV